MPFCRLGTRSASHLNARYREEESTVSGFLAERNACKKCRERILEEQSPEERREPFHAALRTAIEHMRKAQEALSVDHRLVSDAYPGLGGIPKLTQLYGPQYLARLAIRDLNEILREDGVNVEEE